MRLSQIIPCLLTLLAGVAPVHAADYVLVFADEFNADTLDTRVWNIEVNGNGGGNNELQYYAEGNVTVADGCLVITSQKEEYNGRHFTSGRINSLGKMAFQHGKIEARIMFPHTANGLWPAFWMMGNDMATGTGWPNCGEIDIIEAGNSNGIRNGTQDRYFNGACHWGPWANGGHPNYARSITNSYSIMDDEFHLITLYWDEQKVAMYLDQDKYPDVEPYYVMNIDDVSQNNSPGRYFHKQFFVLFNVAVGGDFTGIHSTEGITALAGGPQQMKVDYVRVYQETGKRDFFSPYANSNPIPGDVNDDGIIDIADLNIVINVVLGRDTNGRADVNNNNLIDVADINYLVNILLNS